MRRRSRSRRRRRRMAFARRSAARKRGRVSAGTVAGRRLADDAVARARAVLRRRCAALRQPRRWRLRARAPPRAARRAAAPSSSARSAATSTRRRTCSAARAASASAAARPPRRPAAPAPRRPSRRRRRSSLTALRADGSEAGTYQLPGGNGTVGRETGGIFAGDSYLSPRHATFRIAGRGRAVVKDESSLNGVYKKLARDVPVELRPNDVFRIGQEIIKFEPLAAAARRAPTASSASARRARATSAASRSSSAATTTGNAFPIPEARRPPRPRARRRPLPRRRLRLGPPLPPRVGRRRSSS